MREIKKQEFQYNKVLNFYRGKSKDTNTLLVTTMEHPVSDIMKRNQNTSHIVSNTISFKVNRRKLMIL